MRTVKEALNQIAGRGGRPAIVDMTVAQVREIDPGFCDQRRRLNHRIPNHIGSGRARVWRQR